MEHTANWSMVFWITGGLMFLIFLLLAWSLATMRKRDDEIWDDWERRVMDAEDEEDKPEPDAPEEEQDEKPKPKTRKSRLPLGMAMAGNNILNQHVDLEDLAKQMRDKEGSDRERKRRESASIADNGDLILNTAILQGLTEPVQEGCSMWDNPAPTYEGHGGDYGGGGAGGDWDSSSGTSDYGSSDSGSFDSSSSD